MDTTSPAVSPVGAVVRGLVAGAVGTLATDLSLFACDERAGYAVPPVAGLYKPVWGYDRRTSAGDLSAHPGHGLGTAAVSDRLPTRGGRSA